MFVDEVLSNSAVSLTLPECMEPIVLGVSLPSLDDEQLKGPSNDSLAKRSIKAEP